MFSGIVSGAYKVIGSNKTDFGLRLEVELGESLAVGLKQGASVAVNGVCLTVVDFCELSNGYQKVVFDVVSETLNKTNLLELKAGSLVNIERSLKFGDEVGGHLCSGHIDGTVTLVTIKKIGQSAEYEFNVDKNLNKYIFEKGYVALNGASLTVVTKTEDGFKVALIPETLSNTNLSSLLVGDRVNLEVDKATQAIVDTVIKVLNVKQGS